MQQHILDDVVTLCSENGKKSRKQRILEYFTVMMVHVQALLNVFQLNEGFMFFDRQTRSMSWNHLKVNIPWMNMEV